MQFYDIMSIVFYMSIIIYILSVIKYCVPDILFFFIIFDLLILD